MSAKSSLQRNPAWRSGSRVARCAAPSAVRLRGRRPGNGAGRALRSPRMQAAARCRFLPRLTFHLP